jgi:hypothetical protein
MRKALDCLCNAGRLLSPVDPRRTGYRQAWGAIRSGQMPGHVENGVP